MTGPPWVCDQCGEEVPSEHGLKIHRGKRHPTNGASPKPAAPPKAAGPHNDLADDSPYAAPVVETPPKETGPPPWRERFWGGNDPKRNGAPKKPAPERRPRTKRVSTEGLWTTVWTGAGLALVRSGADVPVGNCLQLQAPIVGDILDDAIADTVFDRFLQPIAGGGERLRKVSAVVAMPILVAALERSPEAAPILEPLLRQAIREHLVAMAPVVKARQKEEEKYRAALADLGMETEAEADPIDAIIEAIFPPRPAPAETNGAAATYATTS